MDCEIEKRLSRSREGDVFLNTEGTDKTEEGTDLGEEMMVLGLLTATL